MDELFTCPDCKGQRYYVGLTSTPNGNDTLDLIVCDNCKTVLTYSVGRIFNSPYEPDLDAESQVWDAKLADYTAARA